MVLKNQLNSMQEQRNISIKMLLIQHFRWRETIKLLLSSPLAAVPTHRDPLRSPYLSLLPPPLPHDPCAGQPGINSYCPSLSIIFYPSIPSGRPFSSLRSLFSPHTHSLPSINALRPNMEGNSTCLRTVSRSRTTAQSSRTFINKKLCW